MDPSIRTYRQLLATIDSELHEDNIKSLKFLCEPHLGTKKSSSTFSTGVEIFDALEKNSKLSQHKLFYLCELLHVIGRVDLASMIDPECEHLITIYSHVDPFRVLLFKLSEELASEDLSRLRYLYNKVPKRVPIEDGIDLFLVMLQQKTVSPTRLDVLRQLFLEIDRLDLAEKISHFLEEHQELTSNLDYREVTPVLESTFSYSDDVHEYQKFELNISGQEEPMCYDPFDKKSLDSITDNEWQSYSPSCPSWHGLSNMKIEDLKGHDTGNIPVSLESAQVVTRLENVAETAAVLPEVPSVNSMAVDESYTPIEYYKMDAEPRGICLVIDNQMFRPDESDPEAVRNLGNREGSDKDSAALKKSFERLKFIVEVETNLTDIGMIQLLKKYSLMDQSQFDCFICCILSHGGENHVFGVNGRKVQLGDITSMFRVQSCPTLARKPKLFFMASCRGKNHQPGAHIPEEPMFYADKPQIDFDPAVWVPNESDFLLGYSTVVSHVSYRSKSQGTFYISALTSVLDKYAHREDLQTLLLRVNAEVSDRIYSREEATGHVVYKQTPAPQHTLRKHLKFL